MYPMLSSTTDGFLRRMSLIFLLAALFTGLAAKPGAAQLYRVVPLPEGCHGTTLNDNGQVAGLNGALPFVWGYGYGEFDFGNTLFAPYTIVANNNNGIILGRRTDLVISGFAWTFATGESPIDLTDVTGMNDYGVVIGAYKDIQFDDVAAYWSAGGGIGTLRPPVGFTSARATAINSLGDIIGTGQDANHTSQPLYWLLGSSARILAPPPASSQPEALAINNNNQVVGRAQTTITDGLSHFFRGAVLWQADGTSKILSQLPQYTASEAVSINDNGLIVGSSGLGPVLWFPNPALDVRDLGQLIAVNSVDTNFRAATKINRRNQVLANNNAGQSFLLTPLFGNECYITSDGLPELLWQNTRTGQTGYWEVDETGYHGTVFAQISGDWRLAGTGQLKGDRAFFGGQDSVHLLWQNRNTGDLAYWDDFRDSISFGKIYATAPLGWNLICGVTLQNDFHSYLLFQNATSGEVVYWKMDSDTYDSAAHLGSVPAEWRLVGSIDITGDGSPDLIFQNSRTGDIAYWEMHGTTVGASVVFSTVPAVWQLQAFADLNDDGSSDFIFRNTKTGDVAYWIMSGQKVARAGSFGTVPLDWKIVGPH